MILGLYAGAAKVPLYDQSYEIAQQAMHDLEVYGVLNDSDVHH